MEINKSKSVKAKNRAHKLKSGVNWQGELKKKGVKQAGVKRLSRNYCSTTKSAEAKQHIDAYLTHDSCKRRTLNESYVCKGFTPITFTAALWSVLLTARRLRTKGSRMTTTYCTQWKRTVNSASEMWFSVQVFEGETHRPTFISPFWAALTCLAWTCRYSNLSCKAIHCAAFELTAACRLCWLPRTSATISGTNLKSGPVVSKCHLDIRSTFHSVRSLCHETDK